MQNLVSEIKVSNYPRFIGLFLLLTGITGVFVKGAGVPFMGLLGVVLFALAFYRPVWFIYLALTLLITRNMFIYYPVYVKFIYVGDSPGDLALYFLRTVQRQTAVYQNIPRLLWGVLFIRQALLFLRKGSSAFKEVEPRLGLAFLFVLFCLVSAIANMVFFSGTQNFIMGTTTPILLFYFMRSIRWTNKEKAMLVGYMAFMCFEAQIATNLINHWPELLRGSLFYGDFAFGTFSFPVSEQSAFLVATCYYIYFFRLLVYGNTGDIVRMGLGLYNILSVAAMYFVGMTGLFTVLGLVYAYINKVISPKQFLIAMIAGAVLLVPAGLVVTNPDIFPQAEHANKQLSDNSTGGNKKLTDIPKVFSFVNLYYMMRDEDKFLFGAGPGMFLSSYGAGPLYAKYNTYSALNLRVVISSSQFIENSFVGIVGDIGLQGYLAFLAFWFSIFAYVNRGNRKRISLGFKPNVVNVAISIILIKFFLISFLRNMLEGYQVMTPVMFWLALVFIEEKQLMESVAAPAPEAGLEEAPVAPLPA